MLTEFCQLRVLLTLLKLVQYDENLFYEQFMYFFLSLMN
jgi:hypothetical protein